MNTEQHASSILAAWKLLDKSRLETALTQALACCTGARSLSSLESERQEVLQSIAEHLRSAAADGCIPDYSQGSGALTLLSHLSGIFCEKQARGSYFQGYGRKTLKFTANSSKCFTEVECRPRG